MTIEVKKEYRWAASWANSITKSDVNAVIRELDTIQKTNGKISAELVITAAKDKKSTLHNYFEWDNKKAAHSWRMRQATLLLGHIEVVSVSDGETKSMRVFEINKRGFGSDKFSYNKTLDGIEDNKYFLPYILSDLTRVKNKLIGLPQYSDALEHIELAMDFLSKESTETKEIKPVLSAVV